LVEAAQNLEVTVLEKMDRLAGEEGVLLLGMLVLLHG
jgi:hypothetical protein